MKKIFIFDDYASIRELLAEELAADGNMIVAIGKPEFVGEAVTAFCPDLVIMDLYTRGGIRWDLLEDLKARIPSTPVLLFTAFHPQEIPRLNRADAWVKKSFVFEGLKQKIGEILAAGETAQSAGRSSAPNGVPQKRTSPCCH